MLQSPSSSQAQIEQAVRLFWQTTKNGWFNRLWAWIFHRPTKLLELDVTLCCQQLQNSHYAGLHSVNIDCIKGSGGRRVACLRRASSHLGGTQFGPGFHRG